MAIVNGLFLRDLIYASLMAELAARIDSGEIVEEDFVPVAETCEFSPEYDKAIIAQELLHSLIPIIHRRVIIELVKFRRRSCNPCLDTDEEVAEQLLCELNDRHPSRWSLYSDEPTGSDATLSIDPLPARNHRGQNDT